MKNRFLVVFFVCLLVAPSVIFAQGSDGTRMEEENSLDVVFEVSFDGYGEGRMLTGFYITRDGRIFQFDNSEDFQSVNQGPARENPQDFTSLPQPISPAGNEPSPKHPVTRESLAKKYGSKARLVGILDRKTLDDMVRLIPAAGAGELPPLEINGNDIVLKDYWAYEAEIGSESLNRVLLGQFLHGDQWTCRKNDAAQTLFSYLQRVLAGK
jgi:hypothetical protein